MVTLVFEVGTALFGACVGSFLNVVIHRLPQEDPAKRSLGGRSHCPYCGVQIRAADNVPVFGWLLLRGRARCCGKPIAARYPLVEALTAALFWLVASHGPWPLPIRGDEVDGLVVASAAEVAGFALSLVFVALLVACTFIDFDHQILPDRLTKPGMALGVLGGLWPGIAGPISADPATPFALRTALASLAGLGAGILVTGGIRKLGTVVFRKEAMGLGDVKFLGMIGAFLGWQGALLTMFLGCIAGALVGGAANLRGGLSARIPFGPYLAIGALVAMLAGGAVIELLFVTWPEWQRSNPASQPVVLGVAAVALLLMFVLVRRGRRHG